MSNLGLVRNYKYSFRLAVDASGQQADEAFFIRDSSAKVFPNDQGFPGNPIQIVVDNEGTSQSKIRVTTSHFTGDPSFDPFASTYGTDFLDSFTQEIYYFQKINPGASISGQLSSGSTERFIRFQLLMAVGADTNDPPSPLRITFVSTVPLVQL